MDSVLCKFTASLDAKLAAAESAGQRLSMDIFSELQKMTLQVRWWNFLARISCWSKIS